jgi:hypothetical protein
MWPWATPLPFSASNTPSAVITPSIIFTIAMIWQARLWPFLLLQITGRLSSSHTFPLAATSGRYDDLGGIDDCQVESQERQNFTVMYMDIIKGGPLDGPDSSIYFQLHNSMTGVDAQCSAHGPSLTPNGGGRSDPYNPDAWYNCFVESTHANITATFQYDSVLDILTINETWPCNYTNPNQP